jgi:hypothetical protein
MKIVAHADALRLEMINKGDIALRLNNGDVLRAMVLEVTSDEALLRLSGGTVLKAKVMETVNLKAGQFVDLVVISKEGNTILLETAHNRHITQHFDSETLSDLLASLDIKPDSLNLQLAAEFIKNGIPVTRDKMNEAHRLVKNFTGLDAEKAAFLLSSDHREIEIAKQIISRLFTTETKSDLLVKLLDGELKLGQLLGEMQEMIRNTGSGGKESVENGGNTAAGAFTGEAGVSAAEETVVSAAEKTVVNTQGETGIHISLKPADGTEKGNSTGETISGGIVESPGKTGKAFLTEEYVNGAGYKAKDLHGEESVGNTGGTHTKNTGGIRADNTGGSRADNTGSIPAGNTGGTPAGNAGSVYERPDSLAEFIEHFFLKIEENNLESKHAALSGNSVLAEETHTDTAVETFSSENDATIAKSDLTETLGAIKSAIRHNGQYVPVSTEAISETVTFITGTIKLINEINYIGVPYMQLPVNINGYKTTAELFVMKRHKGGKRMDPNNLVMYISLDTMNIGRVETILDIKGKNINMRLRTEKQQINDYFRENIDQLYASFSECGYKLSDVKYTIIDSATPPTRLKKLILGMEQAGFEHTRVDLRV